MLAERAKEIRLSEQESGKQPSKKLSWPSEPRWEPFTSNLIKRLHQSKVFGSPLPLPSFCAAAAHSSFSLNPQGINHGTEEAKN